MPPDVPLKGACWKSCQLHLFHCKRSWEMRRDRVIPTGKMAFRVSLCGTLIPHSHDADWSRPHRVTAYTCCTVAVNHFPPELVRSNHWFIFLKRHMQNLHAPDDVRIPHQNCKNPNSLPGRWIFIFLFCSWNTPKFLLLGSHLDIDCVSPLSQFHSEVSNLWAQQIIGMQRNIWMHFHS